MSQLETAASEPTPHDMLKASKRTLPLTAAHERHGAKFTEFGDWYNPVRYGPGFVKEHHLVRSEAGLFDVSHMGRFRITGSDAENYLNYVLTNNVRSLRPGEAQYTFLANEKGGAIDDAYLYKLAENDYMLVVNANNRGKDWSHLVTHKGRYYTCIEDVSEKILMLSLQGPKSQQILESIVGEDGLPDPKRNRFSQTIWQQRKLGIGTTGYTGEPVCYELFVHEDVGEQLLDALVDAGANLAGLAARDSLRLEAGHPLYGHELGLDPEEQEIPIFANKIANAGVRKSGYDEFIGGPALRRQREARDRILLGEGRPEDYEELPRMVQQVLVVDGRKSLHQGDKVYVKNDAGRDVHVGYVLSGGFAPAFDLEGEGIEARATEETSGRRQIATVMIDSAVQYLTYKPVHLYIDGGEKSTIKDERGNRIPKLHLAEIVESNLTSFAPQTRIQPGWEAPPKPEFLPDHEYIERARRLNESSAENHLWRLEDCINTIPSEMPLSAWVIDLVGRDPNGRYNEWRKMIALGKHEQAVRFYCGTQYMFDREMELQQALRTYFGVPFVETRPISGQMANEIVYDAIVEMENRDNPGGEREFLGPVCVHDLAKGGHLSAQVMGALRRYIKYKNDRPDVHWFPVNKDDPMQIDVEGTKDLVARVRPRLMVFGKSVMTKREPVLEIAKFVHDYFGFDNPERPLILYDGAHVLGLLGSAFQEPLTEGADVITGSTHKTYFGTQRGIILSNIGPGHVFERLLPYIEGRAFPGHVSNHHLGPLLGLLGATYEMLAYRQQYQRAVIDSARYFANALDDLGLKVFGSNEGGHWTDTHQVVIQGAAAQGLYLSKLFEANNLITNPQVLQGRSNGDHNIGTASGVRMGTPEMVRYGMEPEDFGTLAEIIADMVKKATGVDDTRWQEPIRNLRSKHQEMRFCFPFAQ